MTWTTADSTSWGSVKSVFQSIAVAGSHCLAAACAYRPGARSAQTASLRSRSKGAGMPRSEEHTSELQSRENLVCRLLLEKKKNTTHYLQVCQDSLKHNTNTWCST